MLARGRTSIEQVAKQVKVGRLRSMVECSYLTAAPRAVAPSGFVHVCHPRHRLVRPRNSFLGGVERNLLSDDLQDRRDRREFKSADVRTSRRNSPAQQVNKLVISPELACQISAAHPSLIIRTQQAPLGRRHS
jgi:hypothetical protein